MIFYKYFLISEGRHNSYVLKNKRRNRGANPYRQNGAPNRMRRITMAKCQTHTLTFEIII